MNVSILTNVNLHMIKSYLDPSHNYFMSNGFNTLCQDLINNKSWFYASESELAFVFFDVNACGATDDALADLREQITEVLLYVRRSAEMRPNTFYFVSDIDFKDERLLPLSRQIEKTDLELSFFNELKNIVNTHRNVFQFPLKNIITDIGRNIFYSRKMDYLSRMPYSVTGLKAISKQIYQCVNAFAGKRKKCLVMDLDNTLWGGVIGEDGIDGIILSNDKNGRPYYDTQRKIKTLKDTGVLLAVASKNNYEDAVQPFQENRFCILKMDDFVCFKADWNEKTSNIVKIAQELNIGLDSIVFLDDNELEREKVRQFLPEVVVVDFPVDITKLPETIDKIYADHFFTLELTDEDKVKTLSYQTESKRRLVEKNCENIEEYIKSLNIKIDLHEMRDCEAERVAQLTQKTNQFNLTTKRYTLAELYEYIENFKNKIYVANVTDKYGDYGLVFTLFLHEEIDYYGIDNLLMSCRVMGRNVEQSIMRKIFDDICKGKTFYGTYIKTLKNKPVEHLLDDFGFELLASQEGVKQYICHEHKITGTLCEVSYAG